MPPSKIPTEILVKIWKDAVSDEDMVADYRRSRKITSLLSQFDRDTRASTLGAQSLWRTINLCWPIPGIDHYLACSGNRQLVLHLNTRQMERWYNEEVTASYVKKWTEFFASNMDSVQHLYLSIHTPYFADILIPALCKAAPNLSSFTLDVCLIKYRAHLFASTTPRITSISITSPQSWPLSAFNTINTATLDISSSNCLEIWPELSRLPKLETLTLIGSRKHTDVPESEPEKILPNIVLHSCRFLTVRKMVSAPLHRLVSSIQLPFLRMIEVHERMELIGDALEPMTVARAWSSASTRDICVTSLIISMELDYREPQVVIEIAGTLFYRHVCSWVNMEKKLPKHDSRVIDALVEMSTSLSFPLGVQPTRLRIACHGAKPADPPTVLSTMSKRPLWNRILKAYPNIEHLEFVGDVNNHKAIESFCDSAGYFPRLRKIDVTSYAPLKQGLADMLVETTNNRTVDLRLMREDRPSRRRRGEILEESRNAYRASCD
ncbi:hypothetical protein SISSUDRAFT_1133316 [Sistotremastrum suecicum HHB10207 ss-3]|uniref:F-box domain-containing protein n=1 Tax=Sistotremastrum suecicum HHB10207 ss-3 TaxID=1314776 RepID=A0A165XGL0_9AGAM|nr:hypothetical protein SISSUDRAFT_1133316 [Sistotremastrum suecicum HHB10207 ss-3]